MIFCKPVLDRAYFLGLILKENTVTMIFALSDLLIALIRLTYAR